MHCLALYCVVMVSLVVDTVRMLLSREADTNAQNFAGDTPLHKAAAGANQQIIDVCVGTTLLVLLLAPRIYGVLIGSVRVVLL
jgi:ankyrin repeat protein